MPFFCRIQKDKFWRLLVFDESTELNDKDAKAPFSINLNWVELDENQISLVHKQILRQFCDLNLLINW